jgi:hypothetical protein
MTDQLITTLTLDQRIEDAKTARTDAGQLVEECWRRYNRSAHEDSEQRTYDFNDARLADDIYREAEATLSGLLDERDQQRANDRLAVA